MEIKTKMKIDSIFYWFKNLQGEKPLTKDEAYSLSKYGRNMTEDDLVKEVISNINSLIKYKASIQSYSVSIDTNHDDSIMSKVKTYFTSKGFPIQEVLVGNGDKYLIIYWSK